MMQILVIGLLSLSTVSAGDGVKPPLPPKDDRRAAPGNACARTLIPIDGAHTCDVGIPACDSCPGKRIEYLPCNDCECGAKQTDCVWGEWGPWSKCSMGSLVDGDCLDCPNCCNGVRERARSISIPAKCSGKPCNGSDKEIEACGQDCDAPGCSWKEWEEWSECSKSCGGGQKYRKRKMVGNKSKTCCNKSTIICDGPSIEWCGCNTQCCGGGAGGCLCEDGGCDCGKCMKGISGPVDCEWEHWSEWLGDCKSTECGAPGALTRTREIKTFALNGGKPCCGESREVKPCGSEACGHDCKYSEWTEWSGCTESCGGGQKYRHREIYFTPNGKDRGGVACAPKSVQKCPAKCYAGQKVDIPGGLCPCIEKKRMKVSCKAPKLPTVGTTEVSETAACNVGDCKCYWKDWTPWSRCSKKCGGGYKVRCKMQGCASELGNSYTADAVRAAMDPCDHRNKDIPTCGKSGWCVSDEWGEATCECDTGKFFVKDAAKSAGGPLSGVCVEKGEFDAFIVGKYVIHNEVVQPVKIAGLQGLQVNDAESIVTETAKSMLNVSPEDVSATYEDSNHAEQLTSTHEHVQKLFLPEDASKFHINVQCTQGHEQCNLVQMELLSALRDKKTQFNEAFRKRAAKDTAYISAAGLPAVISLSEGSLPDVGESSATGSANALLAGVAGIAMVSLAVVGFFKLRKRTSQ